LTKPLKKHNKYTWKFKAVTTVTAPTQCCSRSLGIGIEQALARKLQLKTTYIISLVLSTMGIINNG